MASHEFLICAAHKSSGKTTLSIGLIRALRSAGLSVQPGKKGPDYIDPMWLASAAGRPCYNYDFNTQTEEEIAALFASTDADVRLIEGNKGLYDSVDVEGRYSSAALARLLAVPVVLVLDTEGITRGVAPLLCGYRDFEEIDIAGVILNRTAGPRHEDKLRAAVERYTDIPVLGTVRRNVELTIRERHLGLVPSNEHRETARVIDAIAAEIGRAVDLDRLLEVTAAAAPRASTRALGETFDGTGITIAVARDKAFGFYYPDDLERMARCGMRVIDFSPLDDDTLPTCDALFIGGGFPENFAGALAANERMRRAVRDFAAAGGPVYAECGGLMYLARELEVDGVRHPMAGVIPASVTMRDAPVGRGLVRIAPRAGHPWRRGESGDAVNAHEFHYSALVEADQPLEYAFDVLRGHGADGARDGIVFGNTLAAYVHQRHTAGNPWIRDFARFIHQLQRPGGRDVDQAHRSSG